jgi:hypothetical protein
LKYFYGKENKKEIIPQDMDMTRIKVIESVRNRDERETRFPEKNILNGGKGNGNDGKGS